MAANHNEGAPEVPPKNTDPKVRDLLDYRVGLDQTLPPTPLKNLLAAGGANVYLLSVDSELIDTVQRAGGEQYPVFAISQWGELQGAIDSGRCGIALLDAALLGDKLQKRIGDLTRYSDRVVTLVAADRDVAQELIGPLSERKIHRLLIKPPAFGITRLLLESAVSRCLQLRESAEHPRGRDRGARGSRVPRWALATAIVALLAAVGGAAILTRVWHSARETSGTAASVSATRAPEDAGVRAAAEAKAKADAGVTAPGGAPDRFADLLRRADAAFTEGRLAEPTGDNALDYYLTILAADPTHTVARDRLATVVDALFTQAETALLDNKLDAAGTLLEEIRRAAPSSPRLAFLGAQLERARAEAAAAAAARTTQRQIATTVEQPPAAARQPPPEQKSAPVQPAPAAPSPSPPSELDSLLAIAKSRLARGQLLEPAGDSARAYVDRATHLAGDDARVRAARTELGDALLKGARSALDAGGLDAAARSLTAARSFVANSDALSALAGELEAARRAQVDRRHADLLASARERLRSGALVEPPNDSALFYLTTLRGEGYSTQEARAAWQDLLQALTANVRGPIERGDWAAADRALAALQRADPDSAATHALQHQIEVGRVQQQYLATAAPATELKVLEHPAPTYPPDALARGVEGYVELEYVVDRNGRPRDMVVVASQPSGRFDQAAIAAVSQWRYEPFQRDGQVYERRIRFRVNFALR